MGRDLPFRLTLASGSWGRRLLLEQHGYTFDVLPSNIPEPTEARLGDIRHYVGELAWLKAAATAPKVPDSVIIAADTVGWLDGKVVGKPEGGIDDARHILKWISGRTHELWTGVCLWVRSPGRQGVAQATTPWLGGDWQFCWQERSLVQMKALCDEEIESYLVTRKWEGCSGAYAIEFPNDPYLKVVEGSVSNVIGLPMESLEKAIMWVEKMIEPSTDD